MTAVLRTTWPLLTGIMLLMVGNGIQGSLLGIRGMLEGFSTQQLSWVISGYFVGFLGGSQMAPQLIARVGHVRAFAALGSLISAVLVMYPLVPDALSWTAMRVVIGFCFSAVYVTSESWLNDAATNETRGQTLSAYMIVQLIGIIAAQALLNAADPAGYVLFIIPSILVSLSFLPMLLSAGTAPPFAMARRMSFGRLFQVSPLGCIGTVLIGGANASLMGMAAIWGMSVDLSVAEISVFIAALYAGGLVLQYPVGWLSDHMDRRRLIAALALIGGLILAAGVMAGTVITVLIAGALLVGGVVNPLYALLLAHTNDFLPREDMAGASAGLLFLNGVGAIIGPLVTGWTMERMGAPGYFVVAAVLLTVLAIYALWRMSRREAPSTTPGLAVIAPDATPIAVETALSSSDGDGNVEPEKGTDMTAMERVLEYWLGELGPEGWYAGGTAIDDAIRERFCDLWQQAAAGGLQDWSATARGALAYLIVTDQFPRNIWRGDARSFATDEQARNVARAAIAADHDLEIPEPERQFFYMPLMHSEAMADQEECIRLMTERLPETGEHNLLHAEAHADVIRRFSRFPYRNAALGRDNTAAEQEFLDHGGYMTLVNELRDRE